MKIVHNACFHCLIMVNRLLIEGWRVTVLIHSFCTAIQPSDVEKDLGVLVNFNLNWNQPITKICLNANYWRKMLHKCFIFKSSEIIKKLYTSIIRPKLEYAAVIWNPHTVKCVSRLKIVQRHCRKGSL